MHSIDVALRRNASDVLSEPGIRAIRAIARRTPLLLAVMLTVQLIGGALADPSRAFVPVMSTAATLAGTVSAGAATAGAAATAVSTVSAAASAVTLASIATASHVDAAEQDAAFVLLDSTRVTPAVASNPIAVDRILDAALPAAQVASWWETLSSIERSDLAEASPTLVGNLDGVPLADRIAANRESAARTLAAYPRSGSDLSSSEASYLARAASGAISLYAFDVAEDSIVEMIGDAVAATRTLVFTPGTSATLADFYGGSMQELALWEVANAPASEPVVAFVYKIGSFPQWTVDDGPFDNHRSIVLGVLYDRFNDGLDTTIVGPLARTSVEHSFGSSVGGVAETLGTHFATRVVLGGVGMLAGWERSATTRYVAYVAGNDVTRYIYGLVEGDSLGYAVAPSSANGFEQKDPELSTAWWFLPVRLLSGVLGPAIEVAQGFVNHNKVASAADNTVVLHGVLADVIGSDATDDGGSDGDTPESPTSPHADLVFLPSREYRPEQ